MNSPLLLFLARLIKSIAKLFLICLPLQALGLIMVPLGIKLIDLRENRTNVTARDYRMPYLLRWFDCADWYIGRNTETIQTVHLYSFWYRYYWLALRNPCNYFGYKYLGYKVPELMEIEGNGEYGIGDSAGKEPGLLWTEVNNEVYEYYYIKKWNDTHCLRFRMGWKIGVPFGNLPGSYIQWVLVLQPWKSYSGK